MVSGFLEKQTCLIKIKNLKNFKAIIPITQRLTQTAVFLNLSNFNQKPRFTN